MHSPAESSPRGRPPYAVLALLALATTAKLYISWSSPGSGDIGIWKLFLWVLRNEDGSALYANYPQFNHPPSIIHFLHGITWLRKATGWSLPFCIRLPGILADVGTILLLLRILAPELGRRSVRLALCLTAVAPVSIMVSGHHGNTDPVMVFFVVLSLWLYERPGRLAFSGAAFGLSLCTKVVPVVFLPAVFLHLASARRRMVFLGGVLAVLGASWMPYFAKDPLTVLKRLFGYGSLTGHWGLSRVLHLLPAPLDRTASAYDAYGVYLLLACLVALCLWMNRSRAKPALFSQIGLLSFAFLALTPGFGMQYLAWLVPWTAVVAPLPAGIFHATSGAYLLIAYTGAFGTLPAGIEPGKEPAVVAVPQLLCWLSVVAVAWRQARAIARAS